MRSRRSWRLKPPQFSMWLTAVVCMVVGMAAGPPIRWMDRHYHWRLLDLGPEGARAVIGGLATSMLTFIVFIFSILLLVVQVADSRLSPRAVTRPFQSRRTRIALAAFVFSYAYSMTAVGRIEDNVPQLFVLTAIIADVISIGLFLYLIQNVADDFRPTVVLTQVAADTWRVIASHFPFDFSTISESAPTVDAAVVIKHRGAPGVLTHFDIHSLIKIAEEADCRIELPRRTGDFIATGETLFQLHGTGASVVDWERLNRTVLLGAEQPISLDPLFGMSIIVDIALKALAPNSNDASTVIAAIEHLQYLLNLAGRRRLGPGVGRDDQGQIRLTYRTAQWEDFVELGVHELQAFLGPSPQVRRRFRAMLSQLASTLPDARAASIRDALARLEAPRSLGEPLTKRKDLQQSMYA